MADSVTHQRAKRMRQSMTPPEARLWTQLRGHRLNGYKFRRQHPFGPYILDFYCAAARLAVEVDGRGHDHPEQLEHDRRRTNWLAGHGVRVVRLAAIDVRDELDGVLGFILGCVRDRAGNGGGAPS